ncbi:MAG: hypothetical protein LBF81_04035 [Prevotellaceae bacterium]|nr:hypothetical protein [Prevotellaceae bacterium]
MRKRGDARRNILQSRGARVFYYAPALLRAKSRGCLVAYLSSEGHSPREALNFFVSL